MTAPDLTPAEASAEVEAFFGPGWEAIVREWGNGRTVEAWHFSGVEVSPPTMDSYRDRVAWCKQSWRDAVRPWMEAAIEAKLDSADVDGYAPTDHIISRVLKESDHE